MNYLCASYVKKLILLPILPLRFKCIDLDGNGIITRNEMQFFYEEQLHRMECMAQEPVLFEDILCQIVDMISPEVNFPNILIPKVSCLIICLCASLCFMDCQTEK